MMTNVNQDTIAVVCAADDNYAMPLAVTLRSVVENFKSGKRLALFVIDGGIKESNKQRIVKSLGSKGINLQFLQPDSSLLHEVKLSGRFSIAIYYRLLISELLPINFSKAIYLDSDVIVNCDLSKLWEIEIEDNYVLAVQDLYISHVSSPGGIKNYQELKIPSNSKYFNSGVLVINLDKWRAYSIGEKIFNYIRDNEETISLPDQEGLNVVLLGKWGELDPRWNQITYVYEYQSWPDSQIKRDIQPIYRNLIDEPYIIHFTSSKKPWKPGCKHPKKMQFLHYLGMTDWSGLLPYFYMQIFREFCQYCFWKLKKITEKLGT